MAACRSLAAGHGSTRASPLRHPAKKEAFMILPKIRDPRLITLRRGGTLTDADHHLLALWAAACAEHVLHLFKSAQPQDPRPRHAIEHARAWVHGEVTMMQARAAGGHAMGAAGPARPGSPRRVRRRPGWSRRPRRRARARCGRLRHQGRPYRRARQPGRECGARGVPVAARPAPGRDPRARARRPAPAQRHLLVSLRPLALPRPRSGSGSGSGRSITLWRTGRAGSN